MDPETHYMSPQFNKVHFLLVCIGKLKYQWAFLQLRSHHPQSYLHKTHPLLSLATMEKGCHFSPTVIPFTPALGSILSCPQEPSSISFSLIFYMATSQFLLLFTLNI